LDPIDDTEECNSVCESGNCFDGYECYCGECISDEDVEDTMLNSTSKSLDYVKNDSSVIVGLMLAFGALFLVMFGILCTEGILYLTA
jgi:hypothetical protein